MPVRKVLVVIVNYKSAALTIEGVDSLRREMERPELDLRVVVVENASGDAAVLEQALRGRERVELIVSDKNGGFAYGNNIGFKHGYDSGFYPDYFHLLNPDAQIRPGAIAELVRFLEAHPDVGIAGSNLENPDGSDWSTAFRFPTAFSEIDRGLRFGVVTRLLERWVVPRRMGDEPEEVDWVVGASMMIRREVIERVGGLDEGYFLYYEETDFCWKAKRAGWSSWYVPSSRVVHIAGQSTGLMQRDTSPKRYPAYWFESRRRFFAKNYGVIYALAADAAFAAAFGAGRIKRVLQGRAVHDPPHFLRDTLAHSAVWPRNRRLPPEQTFAPAPPARSGSTAGK